jgi:hypothetical protein
MEHSNKSAVAMTAGKRLLMFLTALALASLLLHNVALAQTRDAASARARAPELNVTADGHPVHLMLTVDKAKGLIGEQGPLEYFGGPVEQKTLIYIIYWIPPNLQDGSATQMAQAYQNVESNMLSNYPAKGLDNNNTQYFQTSFAQGHFVDTNSAGRCCSESVLESLYVDHSFYPGPDCTDSYFGNTNCITDADIQNEIAKVMTLRGWTGGLNKLFMVFTSSNEGSCAGGSCAYVQYCAYHSYFVNAASQYVVYSNEPYGNTSVCQVPGAPSPNGNPAADTAATAAAHELTEAITDPLIDAWLTSSGEEIGDLCAYQYGTVGWDGGKANEMWNGGYFLIQTMYSNYSASVGIGSPLGCVNVGP